MSVIYLADEFRIDSLSISSSEFTHLKIEGISLDELTAALKGVEFKSDVHNDSRVLFLEMMLERKMPPRQKNIVLMIGDVLYVHKFRIVGGAYEHSCYRVTIE